MYAESRHSPRLHGSMRHLISFRAHRARLLAVPEPTSGHSTCCVDCVGFVDRVDCVLWNVFFVGLGVLLMPVGGIAGTGGGSWYSFIHHKLQRVLFEVAKSAFASALALRDDFAGYLTYSPNYCPDVTFPDAEGPRQHVLCDVASARPMSDAHLGAAMMAPGAAARKVEESKVATYGDVPPHHFVSFGVEVYGGLGPTAYGFLRKTQQGFRKRRYMQENVVEGEQVDVDEDEDEDEDEEAAHDVVVRWLAGLIIGRAVGRCLAGG
ncbi:hypothetical protein CYMTET_3120 [Cymbomonas tetramitiformis]|uniref:Uncharacterized protein n=1 Tax=Cymbomonas tetramitiformis TaxID=36881 RepID=A0AAE0LL58_9CHLO|nr:hypothetical protein CYMTET_3120 [Cymbomonas tetramitiformis]